MKKVKKYTVIPLLFAIIVLTTGCPRFQGDPTPPPSTLVTVTIPSPVNSSGCLANHHVQGGTDTKIKLYIVVTSHYFNGGAGKLDLDTKHIEVDPNTTSFPVTLQILTPTDRPVQMETNVLGEQCSECGSQRSANGEGPGGNCFAQSTLGSDGVIYYAAAQPRWQGADNFDTYSTAGFTLKPAPQINNLPKSCDVMCVH